MQKFYLVVYTQTDAHVNHFVCGGGLDLGLNEKGIDDAKKIARRFKKNPLKIKFLISSPELRVVQMTDILHDEIKVKMLLRSAFADQNMGEWEGQPILAAMNFDHPVRGETETQFSKRVESGTLEFLKEKEICMIVTHLRVARRILKFVGLGAEKIEPGIVYAIELPASGTSGHAHLRMV